MIEPTVNQKNDLANLFSNIPDTLRNKLINVYKNIENNYRNGKWEPSELNGGKFCEIVYTIILGYINKSYPNKPSKPKNFLEACRDLEKLPNSINRSLKIQIPRMLIALYEIRNNRGVGHLGGDVDPNQMDATCVLYMSKWIMAELIRIFHSVSISEAQQAVSLVIERINPLVWKIGDKFRILNPNMTAKDKTLFLLYHFSKSQSDKDLANWIEYSNFSRFKKYILLDLHKERLLEYDSSLGIVSISPIGNNYVENLLISLEKANNQHSSQ